MENLNKSGQQRSIRDPKGLQEERRSLRQGARSGGGVAQKLTRDQQALFHEFYNENECAKSKEESLVDCQVPLCVIREMKPLTCTEFKNELPHNKKLLERNNFSPTRHAISRPNAEKIGRHVSSQRTRETLLQLELQAEKTRRSNHLYQLHLKNQRIKELKKKFTQSLVCDSRKVSYRKDDLNRDLDTILQTSQIILKQGFQQLSNEDREEMLRQIVRLNQKIEKRLLNLSLIES